MPVVEVTRRPPSAASVCTAYSAPNTGTPSCCWRKRTEDWLPDLVVPSVFRSETGTLYVLLCAFRWARAASAGVPPRTASSRPSVIAGATGTGSAAVATGGAVVSSSAHAAVSSADPEAATTTPVASIRRILVRLTEPSPSHTCQRGAYAPHG